MYQYEVRTGFWYGLGTRDVGYSGTGDGRNNPEMEDVPDVGPIPRGDYAIGPWYNDRLLGPCVMHLDPINGTDTFGRSLFRIHGNNTKNDASHGCIILNHDVRLEISKSGITSLKVY